MWRRRTGRYRRADLKAYLIGGREIDDNNFVDFSVDLMSRLFKVNADQGSDDPARSTICSNTTQHAALELNFIEHGDEAVLLLLSLHRRCNVVCFVRVTSASRLTHFVITVLSNLLTKF